MVLRRVGITGGTGMLGRHLIPLLEATGLEVVSIQRREHAGIPGWDLGGWLEVDAMDDLFRDVDAVVHAGAMLPIAGVSRAAMFNVNVGSCVCLGAWAATRKVPLVFISSGVVYANPEAERISEDHEIGPNKIGGFYGLTKVFAEDALNRLRRDGLEVAILRPSSIYGLGLPEGKMIAAFLEKARRDEVLALEQPVQDCVDLLHVADLANAVLLVLQKRLWETLNIASGKLCDVEEIASACVNLTGRGRLLIGGEKAGGRGPCQRFNLNVEKARSLLGWVAQIDLREGLRMMLEKEVLFHGRAATAGRVL